MWRLWCPYLLLIFIGASGRLCFVIVAFLGYLHLYCFRWIAKTLIKWREINTEGHALPRLSYVQSIPVISKSKGLPETLRDVHTSTYQICGIEENNESNNQRGSSKSAHTSISFKLGFFIFFWNKEVWVSGELPDVHPL